MTVTPAELCGLASSLSGAKDEASLRAAIGRAYYGSFHACAAWHKKLPLPGSLGTKGGMHEQFIHQLKNPDPTCTPEQKIRSRALGYSLSELKGHRTMADYHIDAIVPASLASEVCAKATTILGKAA